MTGQPPDSPAMAQVNGAMVRYRRHGNGRPVVLLHPLRMQLEYFDPVCSELGDAGVELIAVDLPGHGHSGTPAVDYTASYFTDTVEALLDNLSMADAIVVGESIGASIGLGLAARQCSRVATSCSPPCSCPSSDPSSLRPGPKACSAGCSKADSTTPAT